MCNKSVRADLWADKRRTVRASSLRIKSENR